MPSPTFPDLIAPVWRGRQDREKTNEKDVQSKRITLCPTFDYGLNGFTFPENAYKHSDNDIDTSKLHSLTGLQSPSHNATLLWQQSCNAEPLYASEPSASVEDQLSYFHKSMPDSYVPSELLKQYIEDTITPTFKSASFSKPCIGNCLYHFSEEKEHVVLHPYGPNAMGMQATTFEIDGAKLHVLNEQHLFKMKMPVRGVFGASEGGANSSMACVCSLYGAWAVKTNALKGEASTPSFCARLDYCISDCHVSPFIEEEILFSCENGTVSIWNEFKSLEKKIIGGIKNHCNLKSKFSFHPRVVLSGLHTKASLCDFRCQGKSANLIDFETSSITLIETDPLNPYRYAVASDREIGLGDCRMPGSLYMSCFHHQSDPPLFASFVKRNSLTESPALVTSNGGGGELRVYPITESCETSKQCLSSSSLYLFSRNNNAFVGQQPSLLKEPFRVFDKNWEDSDTDTILGHQFISKENIFFLQLEAKGKLRYRCFSPHCTERNVKEMAGNGTAVNSLGTSINDFIQRTECVTCDYSVVGNRVSNLKSNDSMYEIAKEDISENTRTHPRLLSEITEKNFVTTEGQISNSQSPFFRRINFSEKYVPMRQRSLQKLGNLDNLQKYSHVYYDSKSLCVLPEAFDSKSVQSKVEEQEGVYSASSFLVKQWKGDNIEKNQTGKLIETSNENTSQVSFRDTGEETEKPIVSGRDRQSPPPTAIKRAISKRTRTSPSSRKAKKKGRSRVEGF